MKISKKSFTLVEILVVIAIISILAAIILISYIRAMKSVRDVQRKAIGKEFVIGLAIYYKEKNDYPNSYFPVEGQTYILCDSIWYQNRKICPHKNQIKYIGPVTFPLAFPRGDYVMRGASIYYRKLRPPESDYPGFVFTIPVETGRRSHFVCTKNGCY